MQRARPAARITPTHAPLARRRHASVHASSRWCLDRAPRTCGPPHTGGISVTLVGHPFDTLKVRLQTQPMDKPIYCEAHAAAGAGGWRARIRRTPPRRAWAVCRAARPRGNQGCGRRRQQSRALSRHRQHAACDPHDAARRTPRPCPPQRACSTARARRCSGRASAACTRWAAWRAGAGPPKAAHGVAARSPARPGTAARCASSSPARMRSPPRRTRSHTPRPPPGLPRLLPGRRVAAGGPDVLPRLALRRLWQQQALARD